MFKVVIAAVLVALLSLGSVAHVFAQEATGRPFITKWRGKAGEALKFPIVGTEYKLVIKNEKGEVVKNEEKVTVAGTEESYYHAFTPTADGVYTVEAGPEGVKYMQMRVHQYTPITSNAQLLEVVQFGTVAWESMKEMFFVCEKMTFTAGIDTPDLTKVTDMDGMFAYSHAFNQPLNNWDVSQVTNMDVMFFECHFFNQPLNNWDVSKVTTMGRMFEDCHAFNQPLNNWDVSKVTNMSGMFYGCHAFNQPLNNWDVSKVTNMSGMFLGCSAFNQPLGAWDVSKVTNMYWMFASCHSFNQPLEKWVVGNVTDMSRMFAGYHSFNQPLNNWNVSKVTAMSRMFADCSAFNQPLEKWDVSQVTNMSEMFKECKSFNQPLGAWKLRTAIGSLSTTAMSAINYSLSLIGWAKQTDGASNIPFGENVKGLVYNDAGREARAKLIARGWTFEGDVYKPSEKVAISLAKEGEGTLAIEGYNDETLQAVAEGTELTVIATPKEGYTLTSLMAGSLDIFATKKFTVTGAVTVKAVFTKNGGSNPGGGSTTFAVTLAKEGEGTLAIEGYNDETLQKVAVGTELTVIATPADGYSLTSLMVGTIDILTTKKFTVAETAEVKAVFTKNAVTPKDFKVTLIQPEHGTLAIKDHTAETLNAVAENTELEVIDTPEDATYELKELKANGVDIRATKKFAVTTATTVTAVFGKKEETPDPQLKTFKVTLTQPEHGTLAIKDHTAEALNAVAENTELEVIATPEDATYELKELKANGVDILATKKFTVTEAVTVKAVFKKKGNNGGGNNGGGNGGGSWQPQTPQAVEDAVLASVEVAPNPFTAQLRIVNPEGIAVRYELVTLTGNVIRAGAVEGTETIVDTEALPAGLYFVRFRTADSLKRSVKAIKY